MWSPKYLCKSPGQYKHLFKLIKLNPTYPVQGYINLHYCMDLMLSSSEKEMFKITCKWLKIPFWFIFFLIQN